MPHLKSTVLKSLGAVFLLFTALTAAAGKVVDVTKAGVAGDGATLNTAALQQVIDTCAASGGWLRRRAAARPLNS